MSHLCFDKIAFDILFKLKHMFELPLQNLKWDMFKKYICYFKKYFSALFDKEMSKLFMN